MAAKKAPATPIAAPTAKRTADEILKSNKTSYDTGKRPQRDKATASEVTRANEIVERVTRMKAAKIIYSSRWAEYERVWKMLEDERPEDEKWRANLPDTFAYASIKTAQSAFIDSQVVPVFSKNQDEDLMRANDMRDLYTDIARKGDQDMHLYLTRLDAFKLGTGFLYVYYERDTRVRWDIDSFDPETDAIKYTRKTVDTFADPKTIRISPYLVLVDEQARADFKGTARDCVIIEIIHRDEAKLRYAHLVGGPANFDERFPQTNEVRAATTPDVVNKGVAITANTNTRDVSAKVYTVFAPVELALNMVEILHYWCVRPEDSHEILIMGKPLQVKTPAFPSPIPYIHKELPIVPIRYSMYSGDEFWGQGMIEAVYASIKASRQYDEMMNDRQRLSLFSPVFSDVTDEIDQKLLKVKPLSIIRTRGGVPHQYKIPGLTAADFQLKETYHTAIKRASGIDENMIGGGSGAAGMHRFTATAVAFIRQMAFMRLKDFQFLYKKALIDEVRLKLKLFEQYYSSPLKQAPHLKDRDGLSELAGKIKEFAVKTGDTYTRKKVTSTLFTGPIEDIDLDEQVLTPMTPAELITKWSQVIRDITPFVQAGIVDLDMEKALTEYLSALDVNIDKLRKSPDDDAIAMADGEHSLLTNQNTSQAVFDRILKDGTPDQYLTALHLKRHKQLLSNIGADSSVDPKALKNLVAHIAKDAENYKKLMMAQANKAGANMDKFGSSPLVAGIGAPGHGEGATPKPPSMSINYKDAPPDVRTAMEEAAGLHGGGHDAAPATKKPPMVNASGTGKGLRPPAGTQDKPLMQHG